MQDQPIRSSINRALNSDSSAHTTLAVRHSAHSSVARAESCSAAAATNCEKRPWARRLRLRDVGQAFHVGSDRWLDPDADPVQDLGDDGQRGIFDSGERDLACVAICRDESRGVFGGRGQLGVHGVEYVELFRSDRESRPDPMIDGSISRSARWKSASVMPLASKTMPASWAATRVDGVRILAPPRSPVRRSSRNSISRIRNASRKRRPRDAEFVGELGQRR